MLRDSLWKSIFEASWHSSYKQSRFAKGSGADRWASRDMLVKNSWPHEYGQRRLIVSGSPKCVLWRGTRSSWCFSLPKNNQTPHEIEYNSHNSKSLDGQHLSRHCPPLLGNVHSICWWPSPISCCFKSHCCLFLIQKNILLINMYVYIYMSHYLFAQSILLLKYPIFSLLLWSKLRTYLLGSSFRIPFFASNYSIPNVHWTSSHVNLETSWKHIFFIRCSINQTWFSGISPFSSILFPSRL